MSDERNQRALDAIRAAFGMPDATLEELVERVREMTNVDDTPESLQVKCGTFTEESTQPSEFISVGKVLWREIRQRAEKAEAALASAVSRETELVEALEKSDAALDQLWAATWDRHYGEGLSAEYARSVTQQVNDARNAIRAALAKVGK